MNNPRLAILAVVAVGIAIVAATQTCRDRPPAEATAARDDEVNPAKKVAPRATDTPMDLRERDRLREDAVDPAGVAVTPAEAPAPAPQPVDPERQAQEPTEPAVAEPIPASPTVEAAITATLAAAQDEVAKVRSEMRSKCWSGASRGGIDSAKLAFSLSYDAEGNVLASAVQQSRESYVDGLDRCLAPFAHALTVPAPGEPVSVEVEVELP